MNSKWVVDWSSVEQEQVAAFSVGLKDRLSAVHVPLDALNCQEEHCEEHWTLINQYYCDIVSCLYESSRSSIAKKVAGGHKSIPGWSEFVQKAHSTLGDVSTARRDTLSFFVQFLHRFAINCS